ncbi:MAG: hypothetical protein Q4D61_04630, partial [Cardiobacteriaceae bacterium]|nr:hypothetical protein [Cardiobacteriaceae bacterium]
KGFIQRVVYAIFRGPRYIAHIALGYAALPLTQPTITVSFTTDVAGNVPAIASRRWAKAHPTARHPTRYPNGYSTIL